MTQRRTKPAAQSHARIASDCGFLAAELLARHLPEPRTDWRETFQTAFRISVDDFYTAFESHRAAGFPELNVPDRAR